jgi:phospholipase C
VPAVIISPYVPPGTILGQPNPIPYDHTSIIATVRKRFGGAPLTARDAQAPDLDSVLSLPAPTNLGPPSLQAHPYVPSPKTAAIAQDRPLNGMQEALVGLAANLPSAPGTNLQAHLANLRATGPKQPPATALGSVHDGRNFVKKQLGNYFQGV